MPDCSCCPMRRCFMRRIVILLLISTVLCACASLENRQRETTFDMATSTYGKAIRWSDFEAANKWRSTDEKQTAQPLPAKDIRVTSYKTVRVTPTADGNEIALTVQITYYHNDVMTLKDVTDQQVWKYDADKQTWHITTALPKFK